MPETTPLIKAALNLRGGAGFDVYETRLKILTLSAGMDACHRFIFSGLSPRGINYNVG